MFVGVGRGGRVFENCGEVVPECQFVSIFWSLLSFICNILNNIILQFDLIFVLITQLDFHLLFYFSSSFICSCFFPLITIRVLKPQNSGRDVMIIMRTRVETQSILIKKLLKIKLLSNHRIFEQEQSQIIPNILFH